MIETLQDSDNLSVVWEKGKEESEEQIFVIKMVGWTIA